MTGARFYVADMTGVCFEQVNMSGVLMRGAELFDVDITGEMWNLTINGVAVALLVEVKGL
jgi:uncharacterized protein YjbI with pentapeptide repeats